MSSLQVLQLQATPSSCAAHVSSKRHHFEALGTCSSMALLKQHHSRLIKLGLSTDNDSMGRLIKFCTTSENGDFDYALHVFDTLPHPDAFIYNTIIRGYLQRQQPAHCIIFYLQMLQHSVVPNKFTFPCLIRACCLGNAVEEGAQIHAHIFKFGFATDVFCLNNLIHMFVNFQALEKARRIFDKMPSRDVVSWTTLMSGYAQLGLVDEAIKIFELMPKKNSVSWNAIIAAYVQSNRFHEAFALFNRMRDEKVPLDKYVVASMLSACTGLGALEQGKWIHGYIQNNGIELDTKLATTIIDMYCKCGSLDKAYETFKGLSCKGISSWNCMIGGFAIHGKGKAAIELLKEMEKEAVAPDNITFLNILSACAHSGLVEEGRHYFQYMTEVYGIEHRMEHYGCMVDLLGRAGLLDEAKRLIDRMPMSPDVSVLGALFGACRIYRNIELGEQVGKRVIELEPENSGRYVLLANLYADAGRWEDVANVRRTMNERSVKKVPGFSVIELKGVVSEFIAGGTSHPETKEIYAKVDEMLGCIRSVGYVPQTEGGVNDLIEEEGDNPSYYHSEKLAIALGLLKTRSGETFRITKNLRVCRDCHQASKLISKVFNREIIVRDRNRFHHFKDGECSCKDYW
ncbi:hypothetical protein CCACVL1_17832 [Corchorus capsularis]|uniref:DYW domain-containing protein n=1 Tax=Corchorus capsularis TaxID=210143 RepID=A0A1R3HPW2_COCAP|nr:hypothetical protein CCACVL1_17832 [Corchorus capsularis]